ncbi:MAG TPA: hypothetical protein VFE62_26875 [Gemmataceae bacterium]|nr:hypothetical protein [Gemmataceae bacterium]
MRRFALLVVLFGAVGVPVGSSFVGEKKKADTDDPKVFVVPKGNVYHKSPKCVTLRKSKKINEISLTDAALTGLTPCLQCSPPVREIALEKPIPVTIEKLLAEPKQFDGKRVQINGTVSERTQTGGAGRNGKTTLVVSTGDKKVSVFSDYGVLLQLNDRVVITGIFTKETSKIDATPIRGKIEIQSKTDEKKSAEKELFPNVVDERRIRRRSRLLFPHR